MDKTSQNETLKGGLTPKKEKNYCILLIKFCLHLYFKGLTFFKGYRIVYGHIKFIYYHKKLVHEMHTPAVF